MAALERHANYNMIPKPEQRGKGISGTIQEAYPQLDILTVNVTLTVLHKNIAIAEGDDFTHLSGCPTQNHRPPKGRRA